MAALEIISLDTATPQLRAPATGDTYAAPRAVAVNPEDLTGSADTSSLSVTQTWNTTGTPKAIKVTVTDTASNAASKLAEFTVGVTNVFAVAKDGGFVYAVNNLKWTGADGYSRTFSGTGATANRVYTLPNKDGTIAMTSDITGGGLQDTFMLMGA